MRRTYVAPGSMCFTHNKNYGWHYSFKFFLLVQIIISLFLTLGEYSFLIPTIMLYWGQQILYFYTTIILSVLGYNDPLTQTKSKNKKCCLTVETSLAMDS